MQQCLEMHQQQHKTSYKKENINKIQNTKIGNCKNLETIAKKTQKQKKSKIRKQKEKKKKRETIATVETNE